MSFRSVLLASALAVLSSAALHTGPFSSGTWIPDQFAPTSSDESQKVEFFVALKLRDGDGMREELHDVSMPSRPSYGRHLSIDEIKEKYSPTNDDVASVKNYFEGIVGAEVHVNAVGNMMQVSASMLSIEKHLNTKLGFVKHHMDLTPKRSLRAMDQMTIPADVADKISFISLNAPVSHAKPQSTKTRKTLSAEHITDLVDESITTLSEEPHRSFDVTLDELKQGLSGSQIGDESFGTNTFGRSLGSRVSNAESVYAHLLHDDATATARAMAFDFVDTIEGTEDNSKDSRRRLQVDFDWEGVGLGSSDPSKRLVIVTPGNDEAVIRFAPTCPDGQLNQMSPPCYNRDLSLNEIPEFTAFVVTYSNFRYNMYRSAANPFIFPLQPRDIFCYNSYTTKLCAGNEGFNCTCFTKVRSNPTDFYSETTISASWNWFSLFPFYFLL
jgi:hypothetical protein